MTSPKSLVHLRVARWIAGALVGVLLASGFGIAVAFWLSTDSARAGAAVADVLPTGANPTASVPTPNVGTVQASFARVNTTAGTPVTSYDITRYPASGPGVSATANSACSGTTTITCTVSSQPDGTWTYTNTPKISGSSWVGTESAHSGSVTIDTTLPTVTSINRNGATVRNLGPLVWTVTFSEPVSNVAAANFTVVKNAGVTGGTQTIGAPTATGGAPSATWSVSVTVTGTAGTDTGSIGLNLTSAGTIQDPKTNGLGGSLPAVGQAFTWDTTAPAAPTAIALTNGGGTGAAFVNNANKSSVNANVTFAASSVSADTATLTVSGAGRSPLVTTQPASNGAGTVPFTGLDLSGFTDGTLTFSATSADSISNTSGTATLTRTKDVAAPAAPSTPDLATASDSNITTDNVTSDSTPTFTGTAESGATVALFSDGVQVLPTASATPWSITVSPALADGTSSFTAKATDPAGNTSVASSGLSVTIDTAVPAAPSTPDMDAATDSGSSNTDNITNDATPNFSGTSEALASVTLYDGTGTTTPQGTGTAGAGGAWSFTSTTLSTTGSRTITARATDLAGNQSGASTGLTVTIDTTVPTTPTAPDLSTGSDSGSSSSDNITNDTTPDFQGAIASAEGSAIINLFDGGSQVGTATAAANGSWSIANVSLGAGTHTMTITATDIAGNPSSVSSSITVTIDTSAPTRSSMVMQDVNTDGVVDRVQVTYNEALGTQGSWTSGGTVPSGGSLGAAAVSGTAVNIAVSGTTVNTAVGTFTVGNPTTAPTDLAGNPAATFATTAPADGAGPVVVSIANQASSVTGTTAGSPQAGDTLDVTFSEVVSAPSAVTFTATFNRANNSNVTLTVPGLTTGAGLGSPDYVGSNGSKTTSFTGSSLTRVNGNKTIRLTLGTQSGQAAGTSAGGVVTLTPDEAITDGTNGAVGNFNSVSSVKLF